MAKWLYSYFASWCKIDIAFKFSEWNHEPECKLPKSSGAGAGVTFLEQEQESKKWLRSPLVWSSSRLFAAAPEAMLSSSGNVVTPVEVLAFGIASIQTGVWERRDARWCESRGWRFVDVNKLISCEVYTLNLSVSDCSGGWSTSVHSNRSWANVARPCFLLRIDPTSEKLRITSLSAIVQRLSRKTMTSALLLCVRCSMTLILLAVSFSVFSCSRPMLGFQSSSTAAMLPRHENGIFQPSPRRTHPPQIAVVALVSTGLVSISINAATRRPLEGTCHLPQWVLISATDIRRVAT